METEVGDEVMYFGADAKHWGKKFTVLSVNETYVNLRHDIISLYPNHENYINLTKKQVGKNVVSKMNDILNGIEILLNFGVKLDKNGRFEVPK